MTNLLNFGRDIQGYNAYAPQDAPFKESATLDAGIPSTFTIPSSYPVWIVAFTPQPGTNIWVDFSGAAATAPVGSTFATTTSTLNPGQRTVLAGTEISCVTNNTTADIGVEAWPVGLP